VSWAEYSKKEDFTSNKIRWNFFVKRIDPPSPTRDIVKKEGEIKNEVEPSIDEYDTDSAPFHNGFETDDSDDSDEESSNEEAVEN